MWIRKWYLDCVADDGTTWIGYWGEVRWGALQVTFASSPLSHATSLRREAEPRHAESITWSASSIGVASYELKPRVNAVERELYDGVTWRCIAPSGDAAVELPERTLRGRGYAEVLEMQVAPWSLPIRELRWGRAIGAETSLVWIEWRGGHPLQLAIRGGENVEQ